MPALTSAATTGPSTAGVVAALSALLGDRLSTSADERTHHGRDESYHTPCLPDAVAYPTSVEEVQEIVRICARHGTPVIPFGAGSSLEGHVLALRGGVTPATWTSPSRPG